LDASSIFEGESLTFGVSGEGVSIDPKTGAISIATDALRDSVAITITARNAAGAATQTFRLTVTGEASLVAEPPAALTAPALAGSGRIGSEVTANPGTWSGTPPPELALSWLIGGVGIAGATGPSYRPGPQDDGRPLSVRVTATNAAGSATAESTPVVVTYPAPTLAAPLANVTATQGGAPVKVDAAAAFKGENLRFAVTGAGASIDAKTGALTVPTGAALKDAAVTVTASNSGGTAAASFRATVAAPPASPPVLVTAPTLAGAGTIGTELKLAPGTWSGVPAPTLALQWLRDGAPIAGATTAAYVPVAADDRKPIAARVTATNAAGSAVAVTAAVTAAYPAPTAVAELPDKSFDEDTGAQAVPTAQAFAGQGLVFSVTGAGATINAATGVVSIPTATAVAGAAVTVTATNSGGAVSKSFRVTVKAAPSQPGSVGSVTQNGVTFSFATPRPAGRYATGDWWVLAPVTISKITPSSELRNDLPHTITGSKTNPTPTGRWVHGTMLNPGLGGGYSGDASAPTRGSGGPQGYDGLINTNSGQTQPYNHAMNVDPGATGKPIAFAAGQEGSVAKSVSLTGPNGTGAWEEQGRPTIRDLVVLTVVASVPATGSIRPPQSRAGKAPFGVVSSLDLSIFPSLKLPVGFPSVEAVLSRFIRPHSHACLNGTLQNTYARDNQDNPGRNYAGLIGWAGLLLCGDIPLADKRRLAEAMATLGSDIYGRWLEKGMWIPDGQLNYGRKLPLVLTALMLKHAGMLSAADGSNKAHWQNSWKFPYGGPGPRFAEDGSIFHITQWRIDNPPKPSSKDANPAPYLQSDLGKPEWEIERFYNPAKGNKKLGAAYRNNVIWGLYSHVLTAHLVTGARAAWGWPALFDYCDYQKAWAFAFPQSNMPNAVPQPVQAMWNSYRSRGGTAYRPA
jgi:hypothetical protein